MWFGHKQKQVTAPYEIFKCNKSRNQGKGVHQKKTWNEVATSKKKHCTKLRRWI